MGSNKLIKGKNDLLSQNSELASEWNYQRNGELKPEDVAYQSNKLVWWKCKICGYEWKSTVNNRNRGNGCPCCSNQVVVTGVNDLQTLNKDLSMEWNYEKNEGLLPENIGAGSGKKVWWKCRLCGHEWKTTVASRNNGAGCPRCRKGTQLRRYNETILRDRGSLLENNPELVEEWDYELNSGLDPEKVPSGTRKKAWWKCKTCGHKWEATINSRVHGVGCPLCANKVAVPGKNDLESLRPDLMEEWDYSKNDILPSMVTTGSGKKIWWRCKICGSKWRATISARTTGTGCPECASRAQTSFPEQAIYFYIKQVSGRT